MPTGVLSDSGKNTVASAFAGVALYVSPLRAPALNAATSVGATSFAVSLSVATGDVLTFDKGLSTEETVTVTTVTGSGPFTVSAFTNDAGGSTLTKAHASGAFVSHCPLAATTAHEAATRTANNWGAPAPAGTVTNSPASITVTSATVGSLGYFSAVSAGTYYGAIPVVPQTFGSGGGTGVPHAVETFT